LSEELGTRVVATADWESCVRDADIIVEASRLNAPEPLLKTQWIAQGTFVVPYGTMSAVEIDLLDGLDKVVVDDWGQCKTGKFGSLRRHVETGRLSESNLYGELGEIVCGAKGGRGTDKETNLLWHRGLSLSDIALGHAMLTKAHRLGIGQRLRFS
jgi:ornithine cyclodeaminase